MLNCLDSCPSVKVFLNTSKMFSHNYYNRFNIIIKRSTFLLNRRYQHYSSDRYRFPLEPVVCVHSLLQVRIQKCVAFRNIVFGI